MKKFYSLLALIAMILLPTSLCAKTVTFTINNPASANLFCTPSYQYYYFDEENTKVIEVSDDEYININVTSDYVLDELKVDGTIINNNYLEPSQTTDGCTVEITTKVKPPKVVYIVADPEIVSLVVDNSNIYNATNMKDGKWEIQLPNEYAYMDIKCAGDNVITAMKDSDGNEMLQTYQLFKSMVSNFYTGSLAAEKTYTITCGKLEDLRTMHVSVELGNGKASQVEVRRSSSNELIPESEWSDIALIPGTEYITLSGVYPAILYKVEVNGTKVDPQGSMYYLSDLKNDAKITVYPEFPEAYAPVKFIFTNEDTKGAISINVNNEPVPQSEWSAEGWKVKLGSKMEIFFNTSAYNITSATFNGQELGSYGYFPSKSETITSEDQITISVTATKYPEYKVTLLYDNAEEIIVKVGQNETPVQLAAEGETEFTVSTNDNRLNINAAEGYVIEKIEDGDGNEYTSPIYVSKDLELMIFTEKLERNNVCVFYMETPTQDLYIHSVTLSPYNYDIRVEKTIDFGYTFINYGNFDIPFMISIAPSMDIYLNGEKSEQVAGQAAYTGFDTMEPNSVVKIFNPGTEVSNYALTVDNKSEGAVSILADYITPIESTEAQVFGPTDIEFVTLSAAAAEGQSAFVIKVNGTEVKADKNGKVIAHIDADSTISVEKNSSSSIVEIGAEAPSAVYNLQGVRVSNPRNGLFIKNGKKVIL